MKTNLELLNQTLDLRRYPVHLQNPTWQAWDSADEYLIEHVESLDNDFTEKNLLIFNDDCGALACWFANDKNNWKTIDWVSDSFVSTECCKKNLIKNEVNSDSVNYLESLDVLPNQADLVLIKIPKTTALLEHQLIELQKVITTETQVIAAGKTKIIQKSTLELFEKYLGTTSTSLAKKKSRLIFATPSGDKQDNSPYPSKWKKQKSKLDFNVRNHANVFARQQLDIGGRFFLENLPDCTGKTVVDLGCGNGVIGLYLLQHADDCKVVFVDESYMAVASAKLNVEENFPEKSSQCEFLVTNCLDDFAKSTKFGEPDIVLCNPPFHQQQGITDHIAAQMFEDSHKVLKKGGEFRIIGNRHLDYPRKLKKLFGGIKVIASNMKFSVVSAIKK